MVIHWSMHIDYDHDGNDDMHYSACGVGRGKREGEEWTTARLKTEVSCKNCIKHIRNKERSNDAA